jgi:hypothetical protein
MTIVTATGPHTNEDPGTTGGIRLSSTNNNNWSQGRVPPLTRKGG